MLLEKHVNNIKIIQFKLRIEIVSFLTLNMCILTHKKPFVHVNKWLISRIFSDSKLKCYLFIECAFPPLRWISMYSLCLMVRNVSTLVHFHLSVFICWGCNSLIHALRVGTILSSKESCRKQLACILLFHVLFSLILQGILIFSRWVESQLFFLLDSQRQTPSCLEDRVPFYSTVDIPDETGKTSGNSPKKTF